MEQIKEYILYITIGCLIVQFITGKLQLLSVIWLYHLQKRNEPVGGISVIICSRNNRADLEQNLPYILQQEYPVFEVIVVDDASSDGTEQFLDQLVSQYVHLKIIRIPEKKQPGKKWALQKGVEAAQYPFLLLTDADCKPESTNWIQSHSAFASNTNMVLLGYGKYKKTSGFLNLLIRFDTATIAKQYLSKALWKYPYMGVGRNMGLSKDVSNGFKHIDQHIASGDDDLFVQALSKRSDFKINLEPDSFTISEPKKTWEEWLNQKGRHTTTAPKYSMFAKISLMFNWLSGICFYAGLIMILLTNNYASGWMIFLLHTLSLMLFNGLWMKKLGEKDLIMFIPILNFIYIFVQPVFVIKSMGRNKREWN